MALYQEDYLLPSKGLLGGPKEVTIRNMTTAEEKLLLGSSSNVLDDIINACIVKPEKFDLKEITASDKHFILLKTRIISYGSDYYMYHKCLNGHNHEYKINLDDLRVHYLPDEFVEPYDEFELPVCKETISLKIPRNDELEDVEKKTKKYNRRFPKANGDISYIYRLMTNIAEINGKEPEEVDLQRFIEGLHTRDTAYLKNRISKLEIGFDTSILEVCPICGVDVEFELQVNSEFFRTRFDD